jgi:simple sugar transport system ATP-binding protein
MDAGIGMVHQHFRLIDGMTVAENLHIGWNGAPRVASRSALNAHAAQLAERHGSKLDPAAYVWQLSVGEQQQVAILRTLIRGARVLILDEPTAVLTPEESRELIDAMRAMAEGGSTVVFISHKLREVLAVADTITVMRQGRKVDTVRAADTSERKLARLMIGRDLSRAPKPPGAATAETAATLAGVAALDERRMEALHDVDLELRAGEIVGVAGVAGNGQRELAEVLTGLRRPTRGRVRIGERDLTGRTARAFITAGVGHIPEDRRATGLVQGDTIWRNSVLKTFRRPPVQRFGVLSRRTAKRIARDLCAAVHLSTNDVDASVSHLSGGNAQRLLTGRELDGSSSLLVASHPTRGLDVGGAEDVRNALLAARERGVAILLISEDLDEVLDLSDRVVVMYEGRIVGERTAGTVNREEVGLLMGGARGGDTRSTGG